MSWHLTACQVRAVSPQASVRACHALSRRFDPADPPQHAGPRGMMVVMVFYHGGPPGFSPGDVIRPPGETDDAETIHRMLREHDPALFRIGCPSDGTGRAGAPVAPPWPGAHRNSCPAAAGPPPTPLGGRLPATANLAAIRRLASAPGNLSGPGP